MPALFFCPPQFRTVVRRKEITMWILFSGLGLYLLVRGLIAALKSLRSIPRSTRDWIFF